MSKYNFTKHVKGPDGILHEYHPKTNVKQVDGLEDYVKAMITEAINEVKTSMQIPVGGYYLSSINTDPNISLGYGSWVSEKDRVLIGAGNKYKAGSTGGAETVQITEAQMPHHGHNTNINLSSSEAGGGFELIPYGNFDNRIMVYQVGPIGGFIHGAGGNQAHNNMMPYKAVYIWRRTA